MNGNYMPFKEKIRKIGVYHCQYCAQRVDGWGEWLHSMEIDSLGDELYKLTKGVMIGNCCMHKH
jgi:hypothetical protein